MQELPWKGEGLVIRAGAVQDIVSESGEKLLRES